MKAKNMQKESISTLMEAKYSHSTLLIKIFAEAESNYKNQKIYNRFFFFCQKKFYEILNLKGAFLFLSETLSDV